MLYISAVNRGDVKDTEMESIMDTIVDSLFSVFVTLGILFRNSTVLHQQLH